MMIKHAGSSFLKLVLIASLTLSQSARACLRADDGESKSGASSTATIIQRRPEPRIKLYPNGTTSMAFDETITSVTVMDPEIVAAEISGDHRVTLKGLAQGETIVIASGNGERRTFAVEVQGRPGKTAEQIAAEAALRNKSSRSSGSFTLYFAPPFGGGAGLLREKYEYTQKLGGNRSLHIDGDMFKLFGGSGEGALLQNAISFGMDRISFGISAPSYALDILDSQLNISPLNFFGYTMRGLHLTTTTNSSLRGLEVFGGIARPSPAFFEANEGYLGGALIPIARGSTWSVRGGAFVITPRRKIDGEVGGMVFQADGRYAPDKNTSVDGELAYASGGISWRTRLDLQRGPFFAFGEASRLDRHSPLIGLGAQSGGRLVNSFNIRWVPNNRFNSSISYNRTETEPIASAGHTALNSSILLVSAGYSITSSSNIGLQVAEQKLETNSSASSSSVPPFLFHLETRSAAINHNARFGSRWSNTFEARIISSREARTGARTEQGFSLRDELQHSWEHWSATGYFDYTHNTPSLTSLIIRDPSLLPPLLRRAFESDPVRFLLVNRDLLQSLLPGVVLPQTRSSNVGVRAQGAFSHYTLSSDVGYGEGEIFARCQRDLFASANLNVRLDAANSLQVSGSRSFTMKNTRSFSLLTLSYTHRFGASSGGGFQFTQLLGLDRGHLEGNVFFDLNSNGDQDAGEAGVPGVNVRLVGRTATTDGQGYFSFGAMSPGTYAVTFATDDLGVRLRATTVAEQYITISSRRTSSVNFGVTNYGFVAGRVFNDLLLTGERDAKNASGIIGARVSLKSEAVSSDSAVMTYTVDASGMYQFNNLAPGSYRLEIDSETLPPDFRLPQQTSWTITVEALKGTYLDIPIAAQRAVSGIVFIDKDRDGKFDPGKDEPMKGARVAAGLAEVVTGENGFYILRNLPAGSVEIQLFLPSQIHGRLITIELGAEPTLKRAVNFAIAANGP